MVLRSGEGASQLYWQLAVCVRERIAAGRYAEGAQLPTEEELGRDFGGSRITVCAALDRLATAGLIPTSCVSHFAGSQVTRVDRLRLADGQPLACGRTYLPPHYGRLLGQATMEATTILRQLESGSGLPIVAGRYAIAAACAAGAGAVALAVADGAPVLLVHRRAPHDRGHAGVLPATPLPRRSRVLHH